MKGQLSTEFLVIVALILLLFIPLLVLVYFKASESNAQIAAYQAELTVNRITSVANSVGNLGSGSISTEIFIPPNTQELRIENVGRGAEVVLVVETAGEKSTPLVGTLQYPLSEEKVVLATSRNAGGWVRVNIESKKENGKTVLEIRKA